jgi:hypothetical protein
MKYIDPITFKTIEDLLEWRKLNYKCHVDTFIEWHHDDTADCEEIYNIDGQTYLLAYQQYNYNGTRVYHKEKYSGMYVIYPVRAYEVKNTYYERIDEQYLEQKQNYCIQDIENYEFL